MRTHLSCPDHPRLRALLGGTLSEAEQAELTGHLDACPDCQRALEEQAGDSPSWSAAVRHLDREAPAPDSAYWHAVQDLQNEATRPAPDVEPDEELSLEFLSPAENPDTLGRLGHFDVIEVIGRGGMGVVLKGFDGCLQRHVALKVLDPKLANNETARKRFCREARAAASVTHEHVVSVYQVEREEDSGLPFLVMQMITGESLQQRLDRDAPLPLRDILSIGAQTAAGLAAAHAQGLVHRDVKPANILLENGNRVRLTDFGLARAYDDVKLTQTGFVAGTPLYMAPEQARGESTDHRTDLFSLGSVLYAMCTGRAPFDGTTPFVVLKQVTEEEPRAIHELNPAIPDYLIEIIADLHAKAPDDRIQSAAEVAEMLSGHLAHLPASTGTPTPVPPVRRAAKRAAPAGGALARLAMLAGGMLLGLAGGLLLTEMSGLTHLFPGLFHRAEETGPAPRATLKAGVGPIWSVAFSPDGKTLAMGIDDGTVKFWDPDAQRVRATQTAHKGPIWSVTFSHAGGLMATSSDDGTVKLWDPAEMKVRQTLQPKSPVRVAAFAPDGTRLATGSRNGAVSIWDLGTGRELVKTAGHNGVIMALAFSPDGKTLASASGDKTVKLWDAAGGQEQVTLQGHEGGVYAVAFAPDGNLVASGSWDKTVRLWDAGTGNPVAVLRGHTQDVWAVAFSPDGKTLASGSEDRTVKLWDVVERRARATLPGHSGTIYAVTFSADGATVASGGRDGTVKLWDAR